MPGQWGNTDTVATAYRRGSWGQIAAQILCVATPPAGWIIGIAWWWFLRLSQVDIVLCADGALCEREHHGLRTSEFVIVEEQDPTPDELERAVGEGEKSGS